MTFIVSFPSIVMSDDEGVIKFASDHRYVALDATDAHVLEALAGWRAKFWDLGVLGCDATRYGGLGFGNLSVRVAKLNAPCGERGFAITGTQTALRRDFTINDICVVERYSYRDNRVQSYGPVAPSSESLTHAAFYDLDVQIQAVFHVHSPHLFQYATRLGLAESRPEVAYGTVAMAEEVMRLYREGKLATARALAMRGHPDGVIAFGADVREVGECLVHHVQTAQGIAL